MTRGIKNFDLNIKTGVPRVEHCYRERLQADDFSCESVTDNFKADTDEDAVYFLQDFDWERYFQTHDIDGIHISTPVSIWGVIDNMIWRNMTGNTIPLTDEEVEHLSRGEEPQNNGLRQNDTVDIKIKCPACGVSAGKQEFPVNKKDFFICEHCSVIQAVYVQQRVSKNEPPDGEKEINSEYELTWKETFHTWFSDNLKKQKEVLLKRIDVQDIPQTVVPGMNPFEILRAINIPVCYDDRRGFYKDDRRELFRQAANMKGYSVIEDNRHFLLLTKNAIVPARPYLLVTAHADSIYDRDEEYIYKIDEFATSKYVRSNLDNSAGLTAILNLLVNDTLPDNVIIALSAEEPPYNAIGVGLISEYIKKNGLPVRYVMAVDVTYDNVGTALAVESNRDNLVLANLLLDHLEGQSIDAWPAAPTRADEAEYYKHQGIPGMLIACPVRGKWHGPDNSISPDAFEGFVRGVKESVTFTADFINIKQRLMASAPRINRFYIQVGSEEFHRMFDDGMPFYYINDCEGWDFLNPDYIKLYTHMDNPGIPNLHNDESRIVLMVMRKNISSSVSDSLKGQGHPDARIGTDFVEINSKYYISWVTAYKEGLGAWIRCDF